MSHEALQSIVELTRIWHIYVVHKSNVLVVSDAGECERVMCIVRRLTLSNLFIFCVSEKQTFIDSTHFFLIFVNNEKSSRAREHLI